mmetsp:Transcript_27343/g.43559  ORF Transcript_27343/g.43559 Transcript_27343/m.43559 type:complete len:242 (+) Transcript_27343:1463-2188(+)
MLLLGLLQPRILQLQVLAVLFLFLAERHRQHLAVLQVFVVAALHLHQELGVFFQPGNGLVALPQLLLQPNLPADLRLLPQAGLQLQCAMQLNLQVFAFQQHRLLHHGPFARVPGQEVQGLLLLDLRPLRLRRGVLLLQHGVLAPQPLLERLCRQTERTAVAAPSAGVDVGEMAARRRGGASHVAVGQSHAVLVNKDSVCFRGGPSGALGTSVRSGAAPCGFAGLTCPIVLTVLRVRGGCRI